MPIVKESDASKYRVARAMKQASGTREEQESGNY
jgi:hypothetical protein